ncbi:MAG: hypothetical protein NVSMB14_11590 [Isosphaeraceae bacterium]
MKYAIPLHVYNTKERFSLIVGTKSYQVYKAPIGLKGPVSDDVLSQLDSPYKAIMFPEKPPEWHGLIEEDSAEETEAKANRWFFEEGNQAYQADKRAGFVPRSGMQNVGPIFQTGDERALRNLVQGIAAWVGTKDLSIVIGGPTVEDGDFTVTVFPDGPPSEIGKMLVKIAYRQNAFYGTHWTCDDEKEAHLERSWSPTGVVMKFENPPEADAPTLRAQMIAWARDLGVDLPERCETA